jgi:hypothetical protein
MDLAPDPADDPGWRPVLSGAWMLFLPGVGRRVYRRRTGAQGTNGLTVLRALFLSFCFALVMVGVVVAVLTNTTPPVNRHRLNALPVAIGIVVVGGLCEVGRRLIERPLDCSDDLPLAGTYRTRFFLRIAFSEVPALVGFTGFILTARWWTYPLGLAFTAVGFARLAPTKPHLAQDQAVLDAAGCRRSLSAALAKPAPPGSGRRSQEAPGG